MRLSVRVPMILVALCLATSVTLARDPSKELKKKTFAALQRGDQEGALDCIRQIGEANSEDAAEALVDIMTKLDVLSEQVEAFDSTAAMTVFDACTQALSAIDDEDAREFIYEELANRKSDVRVKIVFVEVCKNYNDAPSTAAMIEALNAKKQQEKVQLALCRAFGDMLCTQAVPALIDLVEEEEDDRNDLWVEAKLALTDITGEAFQAAEDYRSYWEIRGSGFNPATDRGDAEGIGGTVTRSNLFGTEILSKKIVIIIDCSGSMHRKEPLSRRELEGTGIEDTDQDNSAGMCDDCGESHKGVNLPDERKRINRAKAELSRLVQSLEDDVVFNIINYSYEVTPWKDELVRATDKNKADALQYVDRLTDDSLTKTGDALQRAFEISEEANTFYLISDGTPTGDDGYGLDQEGLNEILEMVADLNKFRKVRIHTIGFKGANKPFMENLADQNDGEYHTVD